MPLVVGWASLIPTVADAYVSEPRHIEIAASDLTTALESPARQSGVEIIYQTHQVQDVRTHRVSGDLSPQEAVTKLLEGTWLTLRTDESGAMLIRGPATSRYGTSYRAIAAKGAHDHRTPGCKDARSTTDARYE